MIVINTTRSCNIVTRAGKGEQIFEASNTLLIKKKKKKIQSLIIYHN